MGSPDVLNPSPDIWEEGAELFRRSGIWQTVLAPKADFLPQRRPNPDLAQQLFEIDYELPQEQGEQ